LKNERGFTLVEMLVVLLIISVLILVTIPNVAKHFSSIDKKGCDAYILMVQGQVEAYKLDKNVYPKDVGELVAADYIQKDNQTCPNKEEVIITAEGKVMKADKALDVPDTKSDE
jgi:competence protein ComGC